MFSQSSEAELERLAQHFQKFAEREKEVNFSPLYARLSREIAADPKILSLASHCRSGQPAPNLLLSAVHYLLLKGIQHPLAAFYASLDPTPDLTRDPYPAFKAFCLEYQESITELLANKRVQTNEVRRSVYLLPAFSLVAYRELERPLALLEIGSSAGLNLLWDYYGYSYGDGKRFGVTDSLVQLTTTLQGAKVPQLPDLLPVVTCRTGIDLNPVDITDSEAVDWLRALIWPEHQERVNRFQKAIKLARQNPPRLLKGDALELLPKMLEEVPAEEVACVFHTFAVYQFSREMTEQLSGLLVEASQRRKIYRISIEENSKEPFARLELITYENGTQSSELLAYCAAHGDWIEWLS